MEEQLVSLETAKLAKEKGFRLKNCSRYFQNKLYKFTGTEKLQGIAAPTQSLLQKWLREKYKLFVSVDCYTYDEPEIFSAILSGYDRKRTFIPILIDGFTIYDSYEEALEEGLQEALKLI